jgi:hypothetical protein
MEKKIKTMDSLSLNTEKAQYLSVDVFRPRHYEMSKVQKSRNAE